MTQSRGMQAGEAAFGGIVTALGVYVVVETSRLAAGPGYAAVGPALFPYIVGAGLVVIGLALLREAFFGGPADEAEALDWQAVGLVGGGLILEMLLLGALGWVIAAATLFVAVARAFGNRRYIVNAAVGLAVAGGAYVLFTYGLGLRLPAGLLFERLG